MWKKNKNSVSLLITAIAIAVGGWLSYEAFLRSSANRVLETAMKDAVARGGDRYRIHDSEIKAAHERVSFTPAELSALKWIGNTHRQ